MLIKRAPDPPPCLVPCAPKPAPTTAQKRSLNPRSVLKRALPDWPATNSKADDKKKDTFMVDGCSALTDAEAIVPDNTQVGTRFGESTAKSVAIAGDSVRLGMQQIHGCTMLYILSRKRAYIGGCLIRGTRREHLLIYGPKVISGSPCPSGDGKTPIQTAKPPSKRK